MQAMKQQILLGYKIKIRNMESSKTSTSRISNGLCSGLIHLGFVIFKQLIATLVVLHNDPGDCQVNSLRTWLKVSAGLNAVSTFCNLIIEVFLHDTLGKSGIYKIFYAKLALFSLVWTIIGTVWYYNNPTCGEMGKLQLDFPSGYMLVHVQVIILFIAAGLFLCCCTCVVLVACIGRVERDHGYHKLV